MLRGLAGLPWFTPAVASRVQVVSADDVTETVALCLRPDPSRQMPWSKVTWELTHPQIHDIGEIVAALRAWHGFAPRPRFDFTVMQGVIAMFAEWAGMLGWRSPARATALAQLSASVIGDASAWTNATGIAPRSLETILADRPAGVQDRWFARLYWLKPLAIIALAVFWIATGVIALGPGRAAGMSYLTKAGLGANAAAFWLVAGALFDIAIGFAVLMRRFTRRALQLMLLVSAGYLIIGTIAAPDVWSDPLGPYTKIIPVLLATAFTLAILDDR
jgi:DoxX-like protein